MDENRNNMRMTRGGGRRVNNPPSDETADERTVKRRPSELEQRINHQKKKKQESLKKKRRRTSLMLIFIAVVVAVLLFLTPVFNIKQISIDGNERVTEEQLSELLRPLVGENLCRTGSGKIRKILKSIPYIDEVEVQKTLIKPSVSIYVTEYTPAAILRTDGKSLVTTSNLHVLEEMTDKQKLPAITGVEVSDWRLGGDLRLSSEEKQETLEIMLETMESAGIINNVREIDLNSLSYILMNYDDRIEVRCGTQLDIDRKIRLLKEALTSNSLAANARGTLDLSETGKAVYTP